MAYRAQAAQRCRSVFLGSPRATASAHNSFLIFAEYSCCPIHTRVFFCQRNRTEADGRRWRHGNDLTVMRGVKAVTGRCAAGFRRLFRRDWR